MKKNLFTEAKVPEAYLKLALPVVMGMVVSLVYNMVDTWFISLTGNTNLIAGISLCTPLFTLFIALGDIFGLGGSSVISRLLGQGRKDTARGIGTACLYSAFGFGVIVAALMLLFKAPVLRLLGADEDTGVYAGQYYTYIVLGAPFIIFQLAPSNLLRTEGAAAQSMTGSVLGAVVNMVLDPVFIFALKLGAAGAAIASVIGYICTCAYYAFYILRAKLNLSLRLRDFAISKADACAALAIGLPASVNNFMQTLGIMLTNRCMLAYGNENVAALGIALKVVNIAALVMVGLAFGGQPLMGYCYGAGDMKKLRKVLSFGLIINTATGLFCLLALSLFSKQVTGIFLSDGALADTCARMLTRQLLGMPLMGACLIATCCFQSAGKALPAFLLSICRQGALYAPVLFALDAAFGFEGVISAQAVTDLLTVFAAAALFRLSLWKEVNGGSQTV